MAGQSHAGARDLHDYQRPVCPRKRGFCLDYPADPPLIEEPPDSVNDGAFAAAMDHQGSDAEWQDGPSLLHNGGRGFSFADGHSLIKFNLAEPVPSNESIMHVIKFAWRCSPRLGALYQPGCRLHTSGAAI